MAMTVCKEKTRQRTVPGEANNTSTLRNRIPFLYRKCTEYLLLETTMGKQELGTRMKSEQRAAEQGRHVYVLLATLPLHKPGNRVSRHSQPWLAWVSSKQSPGLVRNSPDIKKK